MKQEEQIEKKVYASYLDFMNHMTLGFFTQVSLTWFVLTPLQENISTR